jgi:hypothetical protein
MQGVVVSFRPDDFEKRFRDFQIFVVTVYPPGSVSEKQKNETKFVRIESIDSNNRKE